MDSAIRWIERHGREIDKAQLLYLTEGNRQPIVEALSKYSNPDGGFGRGLEPDVRLQDSSILATTIGLQLLAFCTAPQSEEHVAQAAKYLSNTYDPISGAWPIVPPNVDDAAHAPWWGYRRPSDCLINPRAELAGYMFRWSPHFDSEIRDRIVNELLTFLEAAKQLEMHDVLVFDRFFSTPNLPQEIRFRHWEKYRSLALDAISTDPQDWSGYGLRPLTVVNSPDHALYSELSDVIEINLDFVEAEQEEDGSWSATWNWYGSFPEHWKEAEKDIRSRVTTMSTVSLIQFGRLSI